MTHKTAIILLAAGVTFAGCGPSTRTTWETVLADFTKRSTALKQGQATVRARLAAVPAAADDPGRAAARTTIEDALVAVGPELAAFDQTLAATKASVGSTFANGSAGEQATAVANAEATLTTAFARVGKTLSNHGPAFTAYQQFAETPSGATR